MQLRVFLAIFLVLGLAGPSSAYRNDMEFVPLFDGDQPLEGCGQKANIALVYKNEAENPLHAFVFMGLPALDTTAMPAMCENTPLASGCLQYFPFVSELGDKYMLPFGAWHYPDIRIFVGAVTDQPGDNVVYSKVFNFRATACSNNTPVPYLMPGNGAPNVSLSNRGPLDHPLYNEKPIAKWTAKNMQILGGADSLAEMVVGVVANPMNVEQVYFIAESSTGQIGHIQVTENQKRMNPDTGVYEFIVKIKAADFTPGKVKIRAIVVPKFGEVVQMAGPITTDEQNKTSRHELWFENNKDNHIVRRTYNIAPNGISNPATCTLQNQASCCGTVSTPCVNMTEATKSHQVRFGNNFSGVKLFFKAGVYVYGTLLGWPGLSTPDGPLFIEGEMTSNGAKLVTFNRSLDITYLGYPGQPMIGGSNVNVKNVNVRKDPTGPAPTNYIIGLGYGGPNVSLIIENMYFRGNGRNPGNCLLGESDPANTTLTHYWDSYLHKFMGNGNAHSYVRVYIGDNSSIAYSNPRLVLNSAAAVNHNVSGINCTPTTVPHGDLLKSADGYVLVDGFWTPKEANNVAQGFFPGYGQFSVNNAKFRVAGPGETGYGAALLIGGVSGEVKNASVINSSFEGGTRRLGACESGPCGYPSLYFHNAFATGTLPGPDAASTQENMAGNPWESPVTGVVYSKDPVTNPFLP